MSHKDKAGSLISLLNQMTRFVYSPVIAESFIMGDVVYVRENII